MKEWNSSLEIDIWVSMVIRDGSESAILPCLIVPLDLRKPTMQNADVGLVILPFQMVLQLCKAVILGQNDSSLTISIVHLAKLLLF